MCRTYELVKSGSGSFQLLPIGACESHYIQLNSASDPPGAADHQYPCRVLKNAVSIPPFIIIIKSLKCQDVVKNVNEVFLKGQDLHSLPEKMKTFGYRQ